MEDKQVNETLRDGRISIYLKADRKARLLRLCQLLDTTASRFVQKALDNEFQRIVSEILQEKNQHDQAGN
jgi:fructose-1,6-bisphosphatase